MTIKAGLYIISTPIGNLGDITLRALETLKNIDIILCEDTRTSQKLLEKYNIKNNLRIYNDHSNEKNRQDIALAIESGKSVGLISDAGTPLISDPGYKLTKLIKDKGLHLDIIPGACSIIGALTISSMPSDRFFFAGFLPKTNDSRQKIFKSLISLNATLIFFEAANRLYEALQDAFKIFGNRNACIVRELTKLHQQVKLENLAELNEYYKQNKIKGEIVLLISGEPAQIEKSSLVEELDIEINLLLKNLSAKDVTEIMLNKYSKDFSKKEIYHKVNKLKAINL